MDNCKTLLPPRCNFFASQLINVNVTRYDDNSTQKKGKWNYKAVRLQLVKWEGGSVTYRVRPGSSKIRCEVGNVMVPC